MFPGARATWIGGLVALLAGAILLLRLGSAELPHVVSTNSVDVGAIVTESRPGATLCAADVDLAAGAREIEMYLAPVGVAPSDLQLRVEVGGRRQVARYLRTFGPWVRFALPERVGRDLVGTLCLITPRGRVQVGGASVQRVPGQPVTEVGGKPLVGLDVTVRLYADRETSLYSQLNQVAQRASVLKRLPGGTAWFWLVIVTFPLVAYGVLRTAATATARSARQLAVLAGLVAVYAGWSWAMLAPVFALPDESEHVAYVQYLAETGHRASAARDERRGYSTEQELLFGALHHNSSILNGGGRPRWESRWDRIYDDRDDGAARGDGGGYTESASGHSPLYYATMAAPYLALRSELDLAQLTVAIRMWNTLFAALVAALAVLAASLLLQRAQALWWSVGVLVALQPVFSMMAGTVNNDTAVNLASAGVVVTLLALWRRGPSRGMACALGAGVALLPLAKVTGFSMVAAASLGWVIVAVVHRQHPRRLALMWAPVVAGGVAAVWLLVLGPVFGGDSTLLNVHPAVEGVAAGVPVSRALQLEYALQMVFPFAHITGQLWPDGVWPLYDIYVDRGWARYGWLTVGLTPGLVTLIGIGLAAGWGLSLGAAVRNRRAVRDWLPGATILLACVGAVFLFVAVAYATPVPRAIPGEQGRYIFPAIVPLAVLFAAGGIAFGARVRALYAGVLCGAMPSIAALAWLSAARGWFF